MKGMMILVFIVVLGSISGYFGHWIASMISVAVPVYLMKVQPAKAALLGFVGIFLVWSLASFIINQGNDGLLATRVGQLMGGLSPYLLTVMAGLVGGVGAAFSGWSTALIRLSLLRG